MNSHGVEFAALSHILFRHTCSKHLLPSRSSATTADMTIAPSDSSSVHVCYSRPPHLCGLRDNDDDDVSPSAPQCRPFPWKWPMVVPYCLAPTPIDNLDEHLAMLETAEAGSMPESLPESRKRFVCLFFVICNHIATRVYTPRCSRSFSDLGATDDQILHKRRCAEK